MKIVGEQQRSVLKLAAGSAKRDTENQLKAMVDEIFQFKEEYGYEDFARMFEHGFDANRRMDAIIETSLNEEQLSFLKDTELARHLATIGESDD